MPCYTPAGLNINTDIWKVNESALYMPCNTTAAVSMCCATGPERTYPDVCVDHGLCHNSYYGNQLWRESCTDPTWKDPACTKLFLNGTGINATMGISLGLFASHPKGRPSCSPIVIVGGQVVNDVEVTDCGTGMYCYGEANIACCSKGEGVYLYNNEQVNFDPSATSTVSSPSSTSTSSTTPASSTASSGAESKNPSAPTSVGSSSNSSDSGLSTGAKAGVGVGVAVGVLAFALVVIWIIWKKKGRRQQEVPEMVQQEEHKDSSQQQSNSSFPAEDRVPEHGMKDRPQSVYSELPGVAKPQQRYELSSQ